MALFAAIATKSGKQVFYTQLRTSYVVLLPEIPKDTPATNVLLRREGYPSFSQLDRQKCVNALGKLSLEFESGILALERSLEQEDTEKSFSTVLDQIESLGAPLDYAWGTLKTLYASKSSLMPSETYFKLNDRARRARMNCFQSRSIYEACKSISDSGEVKEDVTKQRLVDKFLLEGRLNGLELSGMTKEHLDEVMKKLGREREMFRKKLQVATKRFRFIFNDSNVVRDFPSEVIRELSMDSIQPMRGPWSVTLETHVYDAFMEHCPLREMRWNTWHAYRIRASAYQDKEVSNSVHMEEIRYQRNDQAQLLGYNTYAEMSMETKMAGDLNNVQSMIGSLLTIAKPEQEKELASLQEFAKTRGFDGVLQLWDVPYWRRKQKQFLYSYNETEIQEYLPLPKVLSGLFALCEDLFGLEIEDCTQDVETWHPDVQFYKIWDKRSLLGGFYLDPYRRPEEKLYAGENSVWMTGCRSRSTDAKLDPLASLICNFCHPQYGRASLLTLQQTEALFRKFGQVLQHIVSTAKYTEVAGRNSIEWDVVDLCGNLLVHWLYEGRLLADIGSHYKTEAPLSKELVEQICRARIHMIGFDLCQELYLSALDIELHSTREFWLEVMRRLWPKYNCLNLDPKDSHPCSFADIFSGEWGAAYYSHLWTRMVAADVFGAFHESGLDSSHAIRNLGERFKNTFLSSGGGCHPRELFRQFRGRDPSATALPMCLGLKTSFTTKGREAY